MRERGAPNDDYSVWPTQSLRRRSGLQVAQFLNTPKQSRALFVLFLQKAHATRQVFGNNKSIDAHLFSALSA